MWIPILLAAVIDLSPEAAARATANHLPAIQVAVGNSKALIANGAAGVAIEGRKIAVTNGDAFHIGSCTKPFTATVIIA